MIEVNGNSTTTTTPIGTPNLPNTPGSSSQNKPDDNQQLRHFFLSYLQQTPKLPSRRRNQQVTSLGESLTAEEAMAKQKEAEDRKIKEQEEKEKRKKERLDRKGKKTKEMEEKQKKKAEKKEKS